MLNEDEKSRVRLLLGHPNLFRYENPRLEGAIDTLNNQFSLEAEARIRECLAGVAAVDAKILTSAISRAGVRKVDEIEFFKSSVFQDLSRIGRTFISRLSIIVGVPIENDYYSGQGYGGDSYSQFGLSGGGGNRIRLG